MNLSAAGCVMPYKVTRRAFSRLVGVRERLGRAACGKGPDQVGQGFSVEARALAEGSREITGLLRRCEAVASDAVGAITGMGGGAGHVELASALGGAAEQGTKAFLDLGAAYQHVASGLSTSASIYAGTEQDLAAQAMAVRRRL